MDTRTNRHWREEWTSNCFQLNIIEYSYLFMHLRSIIGQAFIIIYYSYNIYQQLLVVFIWITQWYKL